MVTLPNIYASDIKTILDWHKAMRIDRCCPGSLNERYENVIQRLETDLHALQLGNTISETAKKRFEEYAEKQKEILKASQK